MRQLLLNISVALSAWLIVAAPLCGQPTSSIPYKQLTIEVGITPQLGEPLPQEIVFRNADGDQVQLGDGFGESPVVLHLVYYQCPMLCKLSTDGLMRALDTLAFKPGDDFKIVTLSFNPLEGPELSAAARQVAVERVGPEAVQRGWRFLTGDEAAISAVCEAVGFRYKLDPATGQYAHASGVFVLTADGTISRFISGVDFPPRDLQFAIIEASEGKVGTVIDQVMLMCYMYDPATGKYGMTVITAVRAAGLLTVGAMAAGIVIMIRRERRRGTREV